MSWAKGLSEAERSLLSSLYESDYYPILRKVLQLRGQALGNQALSAPTWEQVIKLQGQAALLKEIHQAIKANHADQLKKDQPAD